MLILYIKDEYFVTKALYKMLFYVAHVQKKFVVSKRIQEKRLQFVYMCAYFNIFLL